MISASIHVEEDLRVDALRRLRLLDTAAEERFDRITRLLSTALSVPVSLVSLVDSERQWFKSRVGLEANETGRDIAFCAHAINEPAGKPFVIEDAFLDARFVDNPLVTGDPNVRFYAGQVLRDAAGLPMGTLCAIDRRPRRLTDTESQILVDLAAIVESELRRLDDRKLLNELDAVSERNNLILNTLAEGLVFQDADGRIITWNRAAERVLGLSGDEMSGRRSIDPRWGAVHEDGTAWPGETHPAMEALSTGKPVREQVMGVDHPGRGRVWLRVNAEPVLDASGRAVSVLAAFSDITREHTLAVEQRRFSYLFRHATDVISVVDRNGRGLYRSPSFERVFGYPMSWRDPEGIFGTVHPDDLDEAKEYFERVVAGDHVLEPIVCRFRTAGGEWKALESVAVNLLEEPQVGGVVLTSRDVTERLRIADEIAHSATHDELTNLPNRRRLAARITEAIVRSHREGRLVGLCFVDLDRFKHVNDSYGHAAGDNLLVAAAQSIRSVGRPGDHAARVGGDEFVVVLDSIADADEAFDLASQLRDAIISQVVEGLPQSVVDACIGVAVSRPDDTHSTLLQRADRALYAAKARRGSVELAPV